MESPFKGKTGVKRLINAIGYSFAGFKVAFKKEDAFRQEVLMTLILVPLAIYLSTNAIELVLLIFSTLLVFFLNTNSGSCHNPTNFTVSLTSLSISKNIHVTSYSTLGGASYV